VEKSLGENCNIEDLGDARLVGIEIVFKNDDDEIKLLFVNIYMSFEYGDNADGFIQYLSIVNDICKTYTTPYVYIALLVTLMTM